MSTKIIDEFTNLPISRQRKHQLRHPDNFSKQRRESQRKQFGWIKRYYGAKSYSLDQSKKEAE